jgi:hypothetical protein
VVGHWVGWKRSIRDRDTSWTLFALGFGLFAPRSFPASRDATACTAADRAIVRPSVGQSCGLRLIANTRKPELLGRMVRF